MTLNRPISRRKDGFTLAELLVAMGITAIILTLLVTVTAVALDGWQVSRNKVRAARQAKAALDQFTRDFESMVVRSGNNFEWLHVESNAGLGPSNNPSPNAARLIFFSAATDRYDGAIGTTDDLGGDVSTVCYELFFKNPITGSEAQTEENQPVFVLYRQLVNPDVTFGSSDAPGTLAQEDLDQAFNQFQADQADSSNFLCENIYEMSVVLLVEHSDSTGRTVQQRVPVISTGTSGNAVKAVSEFSLKGNGIEVDGSLAGVYGHGRIVAVDISVSVISDSAMARLRSTSISGAAKDKLVASDTFNYAKTILVPQP